MRRKAYSYIRYSSNRQRWGDSYRRQYEDTEKYCQDNNLELEESYKDLGKSAFKGGRQERLSAFLSDCKEGLISQGSVLIVESLDRLSREQVPKALYQFLEIIKYVDVYTLQDAKLYKSNDSSLDMELIISIAIMARAHNESATKRYRLQKVWENKRANLNNKKLTPNCPHWLKLNDDGTEFIQLPDKVSTIQKIYQLAKEGYGATRIVKYLNKNLDKHQPPQRRRRNSNNELVSTKHWALTTVKRILQDKSVIGEYEPHTGDNSNRRPVGEIVPSYYPQIISPELFKSVQLSKSKNKVGKGRTSSTFSNLFRGFLFCESCGSSMEYTNKGTSPKGGTYLVCSSAKRGGGCTKNKHYRYQPLENLLLSLASCNDFLPITQPVLQTELDTAHYDFKEAESKYQTFVSIMDDFTDPIMLSKMNKLKVIYHSAKQFYGELYNKSLEKITYYDLDTLRSELQNELDSTVRYNNRFNFNAHLQSLFRACDISYSDEDKCILLFFTLEDDVRKIVLCESNYNRALLPMSSNDITLFHCDYSLITEDDLDFKGRAIFEGYIKFPHLLNDPRLNL